MKRINLTLDDQEVRLLNALIEKYGGKAPQVLRDALKLKYDKAFPLYALKTDEKVKIMSPGNLTNEQICEMIRPGSKVGKDTAGNPICIIPGAHSGISAKIPLSMAPEELKKSKKKDYDPMRS